MCSGANGSWRLHLSGLRNHRQQLVVDLWQRVGELAPASYGLLYIQDDEDPAHGNEWVAWPLRRGSTRAEADPFLSPVVPALQDPEPWEQ
ncbi:Imm7 family immunity protein [Sporichthya sp.]|uniref:Imm7 family immunity protein n=1 Tax=Sporichthya sp. TaxID=65475 RepID=UPI00180273FB|nr:hypothetical protein [Sporichthya sp.]